MNIAINFKRKKRKNRKKVKEFNEFELKLHILGFWTSKIAVQALELKENENPSPESKENRKRIMKSL